MKKYIVTVSLVVLCASPAFAGGSRGGSSSLLGIGSILAPVTTAVSALNINALNNVSVLSGNRTNISTIVPVSLKNTNILSGILGGGILGGGHSHGCGCD